MKDLLILVVGFLVLIKGADLFVDAASSLAANLKISKMLIGLTIVAFGTSAPELAVSIKSLISGNGSIVLGNVIGSNIMNILLILGIASLFHFLKVKEVTKRKELPYLLILTITFSLLLSDNLFNKNISNNFTRIDALVICVLFIYYIFHLVKLAKSQKRKTKEKPKYKIFPSIIFTIIGIVCIIFGSNFVVDATVSLTREFGVSERLISLTIVAFGTSLPELVTSVTATRKNEYELALGNIVGSNIMNIGLVIALPVLLFGSISNITFSYLDLIIMNISVILLLLFAQKEKITFKDGITFLIIFLLYYIYVIFI